MITKIVSGGQTGANRGALGAALYGDVPHGGWCPRGRRAEDGWIPAKYRHRETKTRNYEVRTEANVVESDATLVITWGRPRGGTAKTVDFTCKHNKCCHVADFKGGWRQPSVDDIVRWLSGEIEEEE